MTVNRKTWLKQLLMAMLVVSLFISVNTGSDASSTGTYQVKASLLNVRIGPTLHDRTLGTLKNKQLIQVKSIVKGWASFTYQKKTAYVSSKYLERVTSSMIANEFKTIGKNQQLILVTTPTRGMSQATVQTFDKQSNGKWIQRLNISGIIGQKGFVSNFNEGSRGTPTGKYTITEAFGRKANPGTKLKYLKLTNDSVWVDNPKSRYYNTLQSIKKTHEQSEKMYIPQYDYGFVIDYNTKRIPGKGSAIFFHIQKGNYTLGCTAVSEQNVVKILKWLDPNKHPVIIETSLDSAPFTTGAL
jgi:L,D-peptidoglycan transpeptidase YkuD (ErfK/YbiS/YcfS/YnhG family)